MEYKMSLMQATDSSFQKDVLDQKGLVLVDFWAEWCGPCKMLNPILEQLASELSGKVKIVKVNVDQNPETPGNFNVRSIPTLVLFKDGEAISTKVGSLPKSSLEQWIQQNA